MWWSTYNFHCWTTNWSVEPWHIDICRKLNVMLNLVCHMREWNQGRWHWDQRQLKLTTPVCCAGYDHVLIVKTGLTSLGSERSDPLIIVSKLMICKLKSTSIRMGSWPVISLLRIGWKEGERMVWDNRAVFRVNIESSRPQTPDSCHNLITKSQ